MAPSDTYTINVLLLSRLSHEMRQLEKMLVEIRPCACIIEGSVRDGLQHISGWLPDLIITEWKLKDHTAAELLKALKTRREWESIPVIVCLSTYREELKVRAKALGAYEVLVKPLGQQLMSHHLKTLFPTVSPLPEGWSKEEPDREITEVQEIRPHIARIQSLAPLPVLAHTIIEIGNDPNSSAADLRNVIEKDQSLTAKILKTVNSAYYGFHRKIGNIDRAIVILGFNEVMNLTLAASIIGAYDDVAQSPRFSRRKFWVHALGAAYIARSLSSLQVELNAKDAFVIGLLHDFGKVVLDQHFRKLFDRMLESAAAQSRPLYQVAAEIADIDHAGIGGIVAESWKLPMPLVKAIHYHHAPELGHGYHTAVALAHLSNYFCHRHNIGDSGSPVYDEPYEGSLRVLGLEKKDLDAVWASLEMEPEALIRLI